VRIRALARVSKLFDVVARTNDFVFCDFGAPAPRGGFLVALNAESSV
jgi:hypothetical protein